MKLRGHVLVRQSEVQFVLADPNGKGVSHHTSHINLGRKLPGTFHKAMATGRSNQLLRRSPMKHKTTAELEAPLPVLLNRAFKGEL